MEPIEAQRRSLSNGCECLLVALALLLPGGNASAGEQPLNYDLRYHADMQGAARAQISAPSFPASFAFSAPRSEAQEFSPSEFRARKADLFQATYARSKDYIFDAPMLRDTSLAHELSEAKSQDRVRLLTLWQSRASSLSLQAGRHGSPSLQWSTPWMRRGVSSRGLFDRLLPASPGGLVSTVRGAASRQAGATAPAKTLDPGTSPNSK
jgi:hypothetical protein